jgi:superfamily II DNA or RNA helicase
MPFWLGLTATPCRGDGRGLGGLFETMIECPQIAALIEQGFRSRRECMRHRRPT